MSIDSNCRSECRRLLLLLTGQARRVPSALQRYPVRRPRRQHLTQLALRRHLRSHRLHLLLHIQSGPHFIKHTRLFMTRLQQHSLQVGTVSCQIFKRAVGAISANVEAIWCAGWLLHAAVLPTCTALVQRCNSNVRLAVQGLQSQAQRLTKLLWIATTPTALNIRSRPSPGQTMQHRLHW